MVVSHNMAALNASRMYNITGNNFKKSTEKLSSGYKINRAADDAAGLAVSEKMRKQIKGLDRASTNAEDGVSIVQTAEGALNEVHSMLQRCNVLAIQAANGTNSLSDRKAIQAEIDQINSEMDRISSTTKFNETMLFPTNKEVEDIGTGAQSPSEVPAVFHIDYDAENGEMTIVNKSSAVYTSPGGSKRPASILEERIANEFFPNAIKQITDAVPALNSGGFTIDLVINTIDGPSNTLAFASCQLGVKTTGGQNVPYAFNFSFTVDEEDFTDADAQGGSRGGMLEATIAHEMTHSLMYNSFPGFFNQTIADASTPVNDAPFPHWFVEGTAQMVGGGMNTDQGWNNGLASIVAGLSDANDTSRDAAISSYLQSYTVAGREYGHGYLAASYLSHLASDTQGYSPSALANGLNNIFNYLKNNDASLDQAALALTGKTPAQIESEINTASADAVDFVRRIAFASRNGGYGSIITDSFSVGGTDILGNSAKITDMTNFLINGSYALGKVPHAPTTTGWLNLHVGSEADMSNKIDVKLYSINAKALGTSEARVTSENEATEAISIFGNALAYVSAIRGYLGAIQNRLEHTIDNLNNVVENTTAAESRIRDTDMAEEMVEYSKGNILRQAGESMLAQANMSTQGVLSLLQ